MTTQPTPTQECELYEKAHPNSVYVNDVWGYPCAIGSVKCYPNLPWEPLVTKSTK